MELEREFMANLGKDWLSIDDQKNRDKFIGGKITNEDRGKVEFYRWIHYKPKEYYLYIDFEKRIATTWTGQILGKVFSGSAYRSNFGDIRRNIDIIGNNGIKYHGTYYQSVGDWATVRAYKNTK
jgi:hypothetical protein